MDRPSICPWCLSKYPDIRGIVYPTEGMSGAYRCEDVWHKGADYDPNKWVLSAYDEEMLSEGHISLT